MKKLLYLSAFMLGFALTYISAIVVLSCVELKGTSVLQKLSNYYLCAGGWGQSLRRFREIENSPPIDILFLGSSHAYRGFDPRFFASSGYSSYNIGSSSQTPLNSYYLLKKYLPKLRPKLVVLEVYPLLLSKDGLESFYDLVTNLPITPELLEMAVALRNPHAVHVLIKNCLARANSPLDSIKQQAVNNETYIPGGYCETKLTRNNRQFDKIVTTIEISDTQMKFMRKIIEYSRLHKVALLVVTQPLPVETISQIGNYHSLAQSISAVCSNNHTPYIDYNSVTRFDTDADFYDSDHLTPRGVRKFNAIVRDDIQAGSFLPRLASGGS